MASVGAGGRSGHSGDHAKQQQGRNHGEVYQGVLQQTTTQISFVSNSKKIAHILAK